MIYNIEHCQLIELPKIKDSRGSLSFVEGVKHIPFEIKRCFYLYDIPTGECRGAHAHKKLHQFLICLSGSFDVSVDDSLSSIDIHLNRPWYGLHIPPGIWAYEKNFDGGSVCLVLASDIYFEDDYIRDYNIFTNYRKSINTAHQK